jgi:hypothetical protein
MDDINDPIEVADFNGNANNATSINIHGSYLTPANLLLAGGALVGATFFNKISEGILRGVGLGAGLGLGFYGVYKIAQDGDINFDDFTPTAIIGTLDDLYHSCMNSSIWS